MDDFGSFEYHTYESNTNGSEPSNNGNNSGCINFLLVGVVLGFLFLIVAFILKITE